MSSTKIMTGSKPAPKGFRIAIAARGPYLVFGRPPLAMQFIMAGDSGASWYFQEGRHFSTENEPTALCRCGASRRKPYCDGTHAKHEWDPQLNDTGAPLLQNVEVTEGGSLTLSDNGRYCTFARFCEAKGRAWNLVANSEHPQARELAVREASMCPGARLTAWDNATGKPFEPAYDPSLGLIEDIAIGASGGLWVRGGIRIGRENGAAF
ncbi:MAG: CDGSH iron-sulfur domain-containing protein, partial [Ruminococcus flavefaciens]|nr:CDGSH iron-sulfur domain-containing protein [Ruminococcus flavefaciens]